MDGPDGRDYCLSSCNNQMACLERFPHKVDNAMGRIDIEVKIDFRTAKVSMRWHRVPHTPLFHSGNTHYQLATLDTITVDVF